MSSSDVNLEKVQRTLEEITENSRHVKIWHLYNLWKNRTAAIASGNYPEEADQIISKLHHENIIPFYSENGPYKEYAIIGRLNYYLALEKNRHNFTWAQRLRTCIGVAKGLSYLHSGVGDHGRVIHGHLLSRDVLFDEHMEAKLSGLHDSILVRGNQPRPEYRPTSSDIYSSSLKLAVTVDPVFSESNILNIESDIYSYGIIMFEILTGMDSYGHRAIGGYKEQEMINLVLRFHDDGPEQLIDPYIIDNVDRRSFGMFIETAYKCISFNIKDRPTMDETAKTIEDALNVHNQQAVSAIAKRRNRRDSLENFRISREEMSKNFSKESQLIREGRFNVVYRRHLSDGLQKRSAAIKGYLHDKIHKVYFRKELDIVSILHHENIVPFIGYADELGAIISEYAVNGSLDNQLKDPNMSISWTQRLKICIGVAKGFRYLHSGFGEYQAVIHGDFGSRKILLYDNLEPKICGFRESFIFPGYRSDAYLADSAGHIYYKDPVYRQSKIRNKESDVYSYGVVLFEILTGMLANELKCIGDEDPQNLVALVRHYNADQLEKLLDPRIREEIDARSLYTFKEVAYKCISFNVKDRPSWNKIIKRLEEALYIQNHGAASNNTRRFRKLEDSFIPLEDINLGIGVKGPETQIGDGGFGVVYKGQPCERWENHTVAIKCLRPESYQGELENRYASSKQSRCIKGTDSSSINSFNHENIIPYIGYCDEGNEKIIVYEFASNGSLDGHINDKNRRRCLTWEHRLKICLGAARGLDYLHSGLGEDNKVIHRDVKSANILLDHNLVAKICDFGLSKSGLVNQLQTHVYTNAAGTNFYMDPIYHESGFLRKESDVYSFGVVMFELLSGMLAYNRRKIEGGKSKPLINIVRRYYHYKPELLIDPLVRDEIDSRSFDTYSRVAFQCISFNSKERPTMETIVDRIEEALEFHEDISVAFSENLKISESSRHVEIGKLYELWQNRTAAIASGNYPEEADQIISKLHHANIIPFYSKNGPYKEYAIIGRLNDYLEEERNRRNFTWAQRLRACIGVAKGLSYLHS
nr:protein kinase, ATP binding site-containing protein [Tanacetum cinerariifolium]